MAIRPMTGMRMSVGANLSSTEMNAISISSAFRNSGVLAELSSPPSKIFARRLSGAPCPVTIDAECARGADTFLAGRY